MTGGDRRTRLYWGAQLFIILMVLWLALSGTAGWLAGLAASTVGAAIGAWLVPAHPYPWRPHRLVGFAAWFLVESFKGGADVAWRAMHRSLPIEPHTFEYPLKLPPGQPRTLMISTISLLPGTLSADLIQDNTVVVHGIARNSRAAIERLERQIAYLFSLDRLERAG